MPFSLRNTPVSWSVYIAHRSCARKRGIELWLLCENVLMESRMTWDLGHTRDLENTCRRSEWKWGELGLFPLRVPQERRRKRETVYPSLQLPNIERAIKSYDKFRSEQAILNGAKSRIVLGVPQSGSDNLTAGTGRESTSFFITRYEWTMIGRIRRTEN